MEQMDRMDTIRDRGEEAEAILLPVGLKAAAVVARPKEPLPAAVMA